MKRIAVRAALLGAVLLLLCAAVFAAPQVSADGQKLHIENETPGFAASYAANGKMKAVKKVADGCAELDTEGKNATRFKVFGVEDTMRPLEPCLDALALMGDCETDDLRLQDDAPAQQDVYVFGTLTADRNLRISEEQTLHIAEGASLVIPEGSFVGIRGTLALDGTIEIREGGALSLLNDTVRLEIGSSASIVQNGDLLADRAQYDQIKNCLQERQSETESIRICRPDSVPSICNTHFTEPLTIFCEAPAQPQEDAPDWGGKISFFGCTFDEPITIVRNDDYHFDVDFGDSCTANGGVHVIDAEGSKWSDCYPGIFGAKGLSVTGDAIALVYTTYGNSFTLEGVSVTCWGNQKDDGSDQCLAKICYEEDGTRFLSLHTGPNGGMTASSETAVSENFYISNGVDWSGLTVAEGFFIERDANRCDAVWRMYDRFGDKLTKTEFTRPADWDEIDAESQEKFAWALANGIIFTDENNYLHPFDDLYSNHLRIMLQRIAAQLPVYDEEGLAWFFGENGPLSGGSWIVGTCDTHRNELDDRMEEFYHFFVRFSAEVSTAQELAQALENGEINEIWITDDISLTANEPFAPDENDFIHFRNAWEWRSIHVAPGKTLTLTEGTHLCVEDRVCICLDREEQTQSALVLETDSYIDLQGGIDADWENQIIFGENAEIHTYCSHIDAAKRTLEVFGGRLEIPTLTQEELKRYSSYRDWPENEYDRNALICLIEYCGFVPVQDDYGYRWTGYDRTDYQQTCAIIKALFAQISKEEPAIGLKDFEPDWWLDWNAMEELMRQLSAQLPIMEDSETTDFRITDATPWFEISRVRFTNPITVRCDLNCSDFEAGSVNFLGCEFAAGITLVRDPDHAYFSDLKSSTAASLQVVESDEANDPEAGGRVRCCPPTLPENVSAQIGARYYSYVLSEGEKLTANGIFAATDRMESEFEDAMLNRNHPGSLVVYTSAGAHMTVTGTMQEDLYVVGNVDVSGVNADGHTVYLEYDPDVGGPTVCELGTQDVTVNSFGEFHLTGEDSKQVHFTEAAEEAVVYWNGNPLVRELQDDETEEIFLRDDEGWFVANKRFTKHVTVSCDPDSQKPADVPVALLRFENCEFTQGLTLLRDPGHLYTVVLPTCTVTEQIEIKESSELNDPTADGFVGAVVPNGAAVFALARASVTADPGSSFTLNGVTLTGTLGKDPGGSFEAEYRITENGGRLCLWTASDAAFTASGTLSADLIVGGNADFSQLTAGEYVIGLTCGENGRIACDIGDNYVQVLTAGIYDLSGVSCGKLRFPEGAVIYWNGSQKPLPQFVTNGEYNSMGDTAKQTYYNAFPTPEDFKSWKTEARKESTIRPIIYDGTNLDLGG